MAAFVGACFVREDNYLLGLLENKLLRRIGVVSYGMYLCHLFAKHVAVFILGSIELPVAEFAICLVLTYAVSEMSFRFYETRFLRLKERVT